MCLKHVETSWVPPPLPQMMVPPGGPPCGGAYIYYIYYIVCTVYISFYRGKLGFSNNQVPAPSLRPSCGVSLLHRR